ncbi:GDSL-type esterase/lipase family protein [Horticoccus sp. 23ND18S-11]|uniref:GDSL-type esterase/lipase family protein n=1 Tax=Horticoccus sp. 23ND18S-11 TaxID=3391832 RepID=UPI0039C92679
MKCFALLPFAALLALSAPTVRAQAAATPAAAPGSARFAIPATDAGLPGAGPIRRMDWFQKIWTERRSGWARRVQQDQGAVVFLGDSITQGWGGSLGALFPGVKVANRGISGDTTRGVLIRLEEDVLVLKPRGVVLLIGTNDLEEAATPETAAGNLRLILAALKQHNPAMPVILCNVFPSSATKQRPADQIRKLNQLYFAAIKDEPQVTVLDTWALFANDQGDAKPEEFPDLLHPNPAGYLKWTAALRPVLETVGLVPAWPDDFTPEPGFESLFNGRDLTGWRYADGPVFDGLTAASDGRYVARNGRLVVTVARLERAYAKLWTTRPFPKDFVLKLEFRASPNADSGVFVREPQLQVRDYHIAGPYLTLKQYRPLEWNEIVVTVRGGLAHATCNGEVIVDAFPVPATGPIGLESDHGQIEYRRIRVQEAR